MLIYCEPYYTAFHSAFLINSRQTIAQEQTTADCNKLGSLFTWRIVIDKAEFCSQCAFMYAGVTQESGDGKNKEQICLWQLLH